MMKNILWKKIYQMLIDNNTFIGKKLNYEKVKQFYEIKQLAEEFSKQTSDFRYLDIDELSERERNALVLIGVKNSFSLFQKDHIEYIIKMLQHSDHFFINCPDEKNGEVIRIIFGIKDIWS